MNLRATQRKSRENRAAAGLGQVSRHTAVVLLANLASLIFGLLVTVTVAHLFGAGARVDAFFVALSIPQVLGQILLSVALLTIIPAYAKKRTEEGVAGAQAWIAPLYYGGAGLLALLSIGLGAFAGPLAAVFAPGFDAVTRADAAYLLSWLSPLVFLLGLSGMLQGVANANHKFFRPAWAKPMPAVAGVLSLWLFGSSAGLVAFAWGMLAGASVGLVWQWHEVMGQGGFGPRVRGFSESLRCVAHALGVLVAARLVVIGGGLVSAMVASTVAIGAVAILGYAFRIVSIPFLMAASFGVVVFPALAAASADAVEKKEDRLLDQSIRAMGLFGLLSTVVLVLWAPLLVYVLFERGEFGSNASQQTALALRILALAIPLVAINTQVGNAYWARGLRIPRLRIEAAGVAMLLAGSLSFGPVFGIPGLALALVLQYGLQVGLGLWRLPRRTLSTPRLQELLSFRTPFVVAAVITALLWFAVPSVDTLRGVSWGAAFIGVSIAMLGTCGLFVAGCFLLAVPEMDTLLSRILRRLPRFASLLDSHQHELIAGRAREKLFRILARVLPRPRPRATRPEQLDSVLDSATDVTSVVRTFRSTPLAFGAYLGCDAEQSRDALAHAAAAARNRTVDLLGSGPVQLGTPINWHKDYISGFVWPRRRAEQLVLVDLGNDADCKFPWELARCQHWPHLAADGVKPRDAALELARQFGEFVEANPPGCGITYGNAMEAAIRSVNWIVAFKTLGNRVSDTQVQHLAVEMFHAGTYIRRHLENSSAGLNTNHYIANLLGLYVISTYFPSFRASGDWFRFSGNELTRELTSQFDADGAHREGSPAYARLVMEFYVSAYLLGRAASDPRVDQWADTLERACSYLSDLLYDGRLPQVGDDDAGRLLQPPGEEVNDYAYLVQIGAALFGRPDFKTRAGHTARFGLEFWLGPQGVSEYDALPATTPRYGTTVHRCAGIVTRRTPESLLVIQGGRIEERFPRAHLHNDLTSIQFYADGENWLLDPGTYQYSRQSGWRNRMRSTAAHNVVQVDAVEQNRFRSDWLFYLAQDALPMPVAGIRNEVQVGYGSKANPEQIVTRQVGWSTDGRVIRVHDRLEGGGQHELCIGLNVARHPFSYIQPDLLHFRGPRGDFLLYIPTAGGYALTVKDGWRSPRFGVKERCFRVETRATVALPVEMIWRCAAVPADASPEHWAERVMSPRAALSHQSVPA